MFLFVAERWFSWQRWLGFSRAVGGEESAGLLVLAGAVGVQLVGSAIRMSGKLSLPALFVSWSYFSSFLLIGCKWVVTGLPVTLVGFPTSVGWIPIFLGVHLLDPSNIIKLEFAFVLVSPFYIKLKHICGTLGSILSIQLNMSGGLARSYKFCSFWVDNRFQLSGCSKHLNGCQFIFVTMCAIWYLPQSCHVVTFAISRFTDVYQNSARFGPEILVKALFIHPWSWLYYLSSRNYFTRPLCLLELHSLVVRPTSSSRHTLWEFHPFVTHKRFHPAGACPKRMTSSSCCSIDLLIWVYSYVSYSCLH